MKNNQQKDNIEILKRFSAQVEKISGDKYKPLHVYKISFSAEVDLFGEVKSTFPNDDIVNSFLMNLRFFIIKDKNDFNFEKICQLFIESDFKKDKVLGWLNVYHEILNQEAMGLRVGEKTLTTKMVFNTILNEEYFHQEKNQKGMDIIKSSPLIEPFARMKFFDVIGKLRMVICSFDKQIVKKYLKENEN